MTAVEVPPVVGVRWVSPALYVAVRATGPAVCTYDERPPLEVGLPELLLLEELAVRPRPVAEVVDTVAARAGADPAGLAAFAAELVARDLLLDLPPAAAGAAPDDGAAGAVGGEGPPVDGDVTLVAYTPRVFRLCRQGFEHLGHDGEVVARIPATAVDVLACFPRPTTVANAAERHRKAAGAAALDDAGFAATVGGLAAAGLLAAPDEVEGEGVEARYLALMVRHSMRFRRAVKRAVAAHEAAEREREERTGTTRCRVVPIDDRGSPVPLALGTIIAYAKAYKGGALEEHYQFVPEWLTTPQSLARQDLPPSIYLFSNYIWSHGHNLEYSAAIKAANPRHVTIHGGPDTPKYAPDVETYFRQNPHVDVAVHGEGEETAAEVLEALAPSMRAGEPDLSVLRGIPGLSYRDGDTVVRTEDRSRMADVDAIPSPFLTGVFDVHAEAGISMAILETNRGCPYGCTFCDWGSATASRIRKFDLDRVFAELEWCAEHKVPRIFLADANFGIFERDVEIAEKVAELRATHGYPRLFSTNYAKNTTKHLRHIVETLARAGILIQGLLSLQTMDESTLSTVKRSNIKLEKYEDLAREFRKAGLPLFVDLMMGLPGATQASFRSDLQACIDREVTAKMYPTELLVNSPMNEPSYRTEHRIETIDPLGALDPTSRTPDGSTKRALVVSTATFTREDYDEMLDLRHAFMVADNFGVLRQVSRFVRQETGLPEIELYERMRLDARAARHRWPALSFTFRVVPFLGIAPVSWRLLIDEVRDYLVSEVGVADDSALETVLRVQHALLPTPGRRFPLQIELAHDYVAWNQAMVDVKDAGHRDWVDLVPRLRDLPPATFTVDDPHDVCGRALGSEIDGAAHGSWELGTPLARAVSHEHNWDAEDA